MTGNHTYCDEHLVMYIIGITVVQLKPILYINSISVFKNTKIFKKRQCVKGERKFLPSSVRKSTSHACTSIECCIRILGQKC